jgi:ubiquitin-conjugating enzyme E2 C
MSFANQRRVDLTNSKVKEGNSITKRLQSELMSLMMSCPPDISAFPEADNVFRWVATITGATGTPYESLVYKLSIEFPANYPYSPPTVRFETPCFHPNIDQYGNICLDILKDKWSAVYNVRTILLSIQSLLGEPNNDSPLNTFAASLWANQQEFRRTVLKKYEEAKK